MRVLLGFFCGESLCHLNTDTNILLYSLLDEVYDREEDKEEIKKYKGVVYE